MKIKFADKVVVGRGKVEDDSEEKQTLQEEEQQVNIPSVCRRPAYGWCGSWKVTAMFVVATVLMCQAWVLLYLMNLQGNAYFSPATHFVLKDTHGKTLRGKISWSSCGDKSDAVQVKELIVHPDPVNLNRNITFTLNSSLGIDLNSPIKVVVKVQRHVTWFWFTVPCAFGVGSCTYNDVCKLTPFPGPGPCPEPFNKLKLPCRCPLERGLYVVHDGMIDLSAFAHLFPSLLTSGYYYIHGIAYSHGDRLGCYEMYVSIY